MLPSVRNAIVDQTVGVLLSALAARWCVVCVGGEQHPLAGAGSKDVLCGRWDPVVVLRDQLSGGY